MAGRINITDADVERALDLLRDRASLYANAKAERIFQTEMLKVVKAVLVGESQEAAVAAKELWACAQDRYKDQLELIKAAVIKEETERMWREGAQARLDIWRTLESSLRANKLP